MDLQIYKLIASSTLYKQSYTIRADCLQNAAKQARVKFAQKYKVFGDDVKIGLDKSDLKNHIDEIMAKLHN